MCSAHGRSWTRFCPLSPWRLCFCPILLFAVVVSRQAVFHTAILNDTLFLNIVNIVDYSIVVGLDEERRELVSLKFSRVRSMGALSTWHTR